LKDCQAQLDELLKAVDERRVRTKALRVIETAKGDVKCPHCTFHKVVKNGHARGLQRYRCVGCSKTFNATTHRWPVCITRNGSFNRAIALPRA
jgi:transposase-like protein